MPASWSKGQNAPLTGLRLRVTVSTQLSTDLSALLLGPAGQVRSDADFIFYNQPDGPGVGCRPVGGNPRFIELDLAAVPADVDRIITAASLDGPTATFGKASPPTARLDHIDGTPVGSFVLTGLRDERAVIALEFYRRGGQWKVRAVGQGYAGGLAELATVHGVRVDQGSADQSSADNAAQGTQAGPTSPEGPPAQVGWGPHAGQLALGQAAQSPAALPIRVLPGQEQVPPGPDPQERCYDQIWGVFEDAARSTAALDSARDFAEQRLARELSDIVADPAQRNSPQAHAARCEAQRRYEELLTRADADHQRDCSQLRAELVGLSGVLPAPMAAWDNPAWQRWQPPTRPSAAIRVGELRSVPPREPADPDLPRRVGVPPELRIPFVLRLPLSRPVWVDSGTGSPAGAAVLARCLITRLLAAYPPGSLTVHIVDLAGAGAAAATLEPLLRSGSSMVAPRVTSPAQLLELLTSLVSRVDMVRMAHRGGAGDLVADRVAFGAHLLVLHDFPFGLDDRGMSAIRFLTEEGGAAGISVLLVADPADAVGSGGAAELVWHAATRLTSQPHDSIGDPWVGNIWTYLPDGPDAGRTVDAVLASLAAR